MVTLQEKLHSTIEKYQPKDFSYFFEDLDGLSSKQLQDHYKLYEGYVNKANLIQEKIKTVSKSNMNPTYSEFRELQVAQSYALNGMILHELYFSNLTDKDTEPSEDFKGTILRDFDTWDNYIEELNAVALSMRGWAITAYNYRDGKIHNYGMDTHNLFVPMSVKPLLVIDVYEHAYMIDYSINRAEYLDAFFDNVNWDVVNQRFEAALKL